jgi:flagellar motor component MotA
MNRHQIKVTPELQQSTCGCCIPTLLIGLFVSSCSTNNPIIWHLPNPCGDKALKRLDIIPRFIGYFGGIGLIALGIVLGGDALAFFSAPAVLIVLGGGIFFTMAAHGFAGLKNAFTASIGNKNRATGSEKTHVAVLLTLKNAFLGAAAIGMLIGLIQMLGNMDDPSQIGPSMAVALLSLLYGFLLGDLLVGPLANRLLAHSTTGRDSNATPPPPSTPPFPSPSPPSSTQTR